MLPLKMSEQIFLKHRLIKDKSGNYHNDNYIARENALITAIFLKDEVLHNPSSYYDDNYWNQVIEYIKNIKD